MKTPNFWRERNVVSYVLWPLSLLYWLGFKISWMLSRKRKYKIKIICVGNLTAGGAGKTPVAMAIGKILQKEKVKFAYLSSGYKGRFGDFCEVDEKSSHEEVGDEPLLLSSVGPTFVTNDRAIGIKKLETRGFDVVILDDGMQDGRIVKDLLIVVVDGKIKFGNGFMMPAGPLRSWVKRGLNIADRIIAVGGADRDLMSKIELCGDVAKLVIADVNSSNVDKFKDKKIFAFCGIGYPEKFFDFLSSNGLSLAKKEAFADHYAYKNGDLERLIALADENGLKLLTTKKDWIKFDEKYRKKIDFVDIDFTFKEENVIVRDLKNVMK